MDTRCMIGRAFHFRGAGTPVLAYSTVCRARSLRSITIGGMYQCSTCSSRAVTLGKPTALSSWGDESASGKRPPSAMPMRKKLGAPHPPHRTFGHRYRNRLMRPKSSDDGQRESGNMGGNSIDNARRSTLLMSWRLLRLCNHLLPPACGCQRPTLIQTGSILCRSCPYVHMRWRITDEASCFASLRRLYRDSFRAAFPGTLAPGVEAEAVACDCCRDRLGQDHGHPRCERHSEP